MGCFMWHWCSETCSLLQAMKDGVIEARLNHAEKYMQSAETVDVYGTGEPQHQFDTRIGFCLELYNQAVKVGLLVLVRTIALCF